LTGQLSNAALALIDRPVIAFLATVDQKGRPQVTPVWVDHEGNDLIINTAEGRAKTNNLKRDPQVGISLVDPDDPYSGISLHGKVTEITTDGAEDHIDSLAKKYLNLDSYPLRREGEVRVKVRIEPESVAMQPAG
jgi:PPOX class probable F420-dependent enzyme